MKKRIIFLIVLLAGLFVFWIFFRTQSHVPAEKTQESTRKETEITKNVNQSKSESKYVPPEKIMEKLEKAKKDHSIYIEMIKSGSKMEALASAKQMALLGDEILPGLHKELESDAKAFDKIRIIEVMSAIGSKESLEFMKSFYEKNKQNHFLNTSIFYNFSKFKYPEASNYLIETIPQISYEGELFSALRSLGFIGSENAILLLKKYLNDPSERIKSAAILAASRLGDKSMLDIAREEVLKSKDKDMKIACILTLGILGNEKDLEILKKLENLNDYFVQISLKQTRDRMEFRKASEVEKTKLLKTGLFGGDRIETEWMLDELCRLDDFQMIDATRDVLKFPSSPFFLEVVRCLKQRGVQLQKEIFGYSALKTGKR